MLHPWTVARDKSAAMARMSADTKECLPRSRLAMKKTTSEQVVFQPGCMTGRRIIWKGHSDTLGRHEQVGWYSVSQVSDESSMYIIEVDMGGEWDGEEGGGRREERQGNHQPKLYLHSAAFILPRAMPSSIFLGTLASAACSFSVGCTPKKCRLSENMGFESLR